MTAVVIWTQCLRPMNQDSKAEDRRTKYHDFKASPGTQRDWFRLHLRPVQRN